ncbi:MAG: DUF6064 family protein [Flavonifractor plautii]
MGPANRPLARSPGYVRAVLHPKAPWAAKFALGIANLWIGLAFFARYGSEPIQKYFALPLYLLFGILFLYESRHNGADTLQSHRRAGPASAALAALPPRLLLLETPFRKW